MKRTPPGFEHIELMQLWHAISQYIENDELDTLPPGAKAAAESAREKLDGYVAAMAEQCSEPVKLTPAMLKLMARAYEQPARFYAKECPSPMWIKMRHLFDQIGGMLDATWKLNETGRVAYLEAVA